MRLQAIHLTQGTRIRHVSRDVYVTRNVQFRVTYTSKLRNIHEIIETVVR